jgi:threonylcarbamoyladenosine tRNA methylthiotransferase MtaB
MKKFMVKTLGCKANFSDGQSIEADLLSRGFSTANSTQDADFVIINSCTVTDEADLQSQKMVRDLKKKNPGLKVIYTGCAAEVDPQAALRIPGVSAVLGNQNKFEAGELIARHIQAESTSLQPEILGEVASYGELKSRHPMDREWPLPEEGAIGSPILPSGSSTFRTRSFLKIQEGCDSFCTYCIIPYGRGPARSLKIDAILDRVNDLVASGIREVVLTGTNIGDYGLDWSGTFQLDPLVEAILTQTKLERLRIGSLDPTEISDSLIGLMENHEAFCPHFHVSLQHTESRILRLMKRKYSKDSVESLFSRIAKMKRKPFVGMDVIVGFPGETEEDFAAMHATLSAYEWNRLHVFPYSEREGTPATRLPGSVERSIRKVRARALQEMSLKRMTGFFSNARIGILKGVLLEGMVKGPDGKREWISGYSPDYQRVLVPSRGDLELRNSVIHVDARNWVVDRASGEVSWIGAIHE